MDLSPVIAQLKADEGLRLHPYRCTAGRLTIGYGRNLEDVGISKEEAESLLLADIERVEKSLQSLKAYRDLDEVRQGVLINMCFNLGKSKLMQFKRMWSAISRGCYQEAAAEMMDSLWAHQVGQRAWRLADQMIKGA